MSKSLPDSANIEWLKKTAKQELSKQLDAGENIQLADAQRAVARRYGFSSWRALRSSVLSDDAVDAKEAVDTVGPCSPFFIVSDLATSIEYYTKQLGFDCRFKGPEGDAFFAILGRGAAQIITKQIGEDVPPMPNNHKHAWARLDAFIYSSSPDALFDEYRGRGTSFRKTLHDDEDDGLRGFEVSDPDGYVCFFGRPK